MLEACKSDSAEALVYWKTSSGCIFVRWLGSEFGCLAGGTDGQQRLKRFQQMGLTIQDEKIKNDITGKDDISAPMSKMMWTSGDNDKVRVKVQACQQAQ